MSTSPYPVRVAAELDTGLTRWLWLVKWLLAIPHYVVLAFLWAAFVVLSVVAMVAIVVTGRYPRAVFDFNVGVLRWTWRVAYYAYGALGTDKYPPFTLSERPDYPAHLDVDYPEHLSRGLALVKWWLLAIPHYLVVGFFVGGGLWFGNRASQETWPVAGWGGGLIGLLVLVAAVVLAFTGRYPQNIFDFVLGLNRWVIRVAAYAALMTDVYPPFRLDLGSDEPGGGPVVRRPGHAAPGYVDPGHAGRTRRHAVRGGAAAAASTPAPSTWTAGRVIGVVVSSCVLLVSVGLGAAGLAVLRRRRQPAQGRLPDERRADASRRRATHSPPTPCDWSRAAVRTPLPQRFLGSVRVTVAPAAGLGRLRRHRLRRGRGAVPRRRRAHDGHRRAAARRRRAASTGSPRPGTGRSHPGPSTSGWPAPRVAGPRSVEWAPRSGRLGRGRHERGRVEAGERRRVGGRPAARRCAPSAWVLLALATLGLRRRRGRAGPQPAPLVAGPRGSRGAVGLMDERTWTRTGQRGGDARQRRAPGRIRPSGPSRASATARRTARSSWSWSRATTP